MSHLVDTAMEMVDECVRASEKFGPFNSTHEGYAVILEELDEAWDEIKANNTEAAIKEMVQVGAMAMRFVAEFRTSGAGDSS